MDDFDRQRPWRQRTAPSLKDQPSNVRALGQRCSAELGPGPEQDDERSRTTGPCVFGYEFKGTDRTTTFAA
jgi:hypothetical protein